MDSDVDTAVGRGGREFVGTVVSQGAIHSLTVEVSRTVLHKRYRKYLSRTKRVSVHDSEGVCGLGDTVVIRECRPLSRTKRWIVVERRV